ncbi:hypothetical protein AVEN_165431-1 [Araneus ventricosus]|uniref:C2H2-type domain-containing protein n=1 Tax=Araneus ventricosus TaxID=182803 RepID=A0A4Y2AVX5_ARAVE|nr:hypothetical protein AVEN_165431-1 [Araneus ventricosus]
MATAGFSCLYCSKWFRSKIGLGVHTQSQHRQQYEAAIQIPKSKTRLSSEELALMAMSEATLIKQGKTSEINTELLSQFPNRTREAIKGQRRQLKYKNLVKEYVQSGLPSATPVVAVPSSSATSVMSDSSLTSNLSMASSSIVSGDLPVVLSSNFSDSSIDAMDAHELTLSFNEDLVTDSKSDVVSSEMLNDSSLDAIQTIREVRYEIDAASSSFMDLSANDSVRQDRASFSETAFSFDETDSKLIDYLDLLFRSDRSSMLSKELKDVWSNFRLRPCKDSLFLRTCLIFEVLLPDKTPTSVKPRVVRRSSPREDLSRRVRRRIEYAKAQRLFFKNPSRYSDSL